MLPRPIHARALLSGAIISAAAANVITVQGGGIGNFTAGVGEVVGSVFISMPPITRVFCLALTLKCLFTM